MPALGLTGCVILCVIVFNPPLRGCGALCLCVGKMCRFTSLMATLMYTHTHTGRGGQENGGGCGGGVGGEPKKTLRHSQSAHTPHTFKHAHANQHSADTQHRLIFVAVTRFSNASRIHTHTHTRLAPQFVRRRRRRPHSIPIDPRHGRLCGVETRTHGCDGVMGCVCVCCWYGWAERDARDVFYTGKCMYVLCCV